MVLLRGSHLVALLGVPAGAVTARDLLRAPPVSMRYDSDLIVSKGSQRRPQRTHRKPILRTLCRKTMLPSSYSSDHAQRSYSRSRMQRTTTGSICSFCALCLISAASHSSSRQTTMARRLTQRTMKTRFTPRIREENNPATTDGSSLVPRVLRDGGLGEVAFYKTVARAATKYRKGLGRPARAPMAGDAWFHPQQRASDDPERAPLRLIQERVSTRFLCAVTGN
jgi:hypothetical protein